MPVDLDQLIAAPRPPAVAIDDMIAEPGRAPQDWQSPAPPESYGGRVTKPPVADSADVRRVAALPRRPVVEPGSPMALALVERARRKYHLPERACRCAVPTDQGGLGRACVRELNAIQAQALHELSVVGGLVGFISVGWGKTILGILAPLAVPGCRTAMLLVPPKLVEQLVREYDLLAEHWRVPNIVVHDATCHSDLTRGPVDAWPTLHVYPYTRLSLPANTARMGKIAPDLVLADEGHKLRHVGSVGTNRVMSYHEAAGFRFAAWSGSMTDSSVLDYAHLSAMALGEGSPLPIVPECAQDWARAIDPSEWRAPLGALEKICRPGEKLGDGYHHRLVETQGVIVTKTSVIDAALQIRERVVPEIPAEIQRMLREVRDTWTRPDGADLEADGAFAVARCLRQLAAGFYYRWRFDNGETLEQIIAWLDARKAYFSEQNEMLRGRRVEHLDSPYWARQAAMRAWGDVPTPDPLPGQPPLPYWRPASWPRWRDLAPTVKPSTEAVRVDDYLVRDAAAWAAEHRGIVWYSAAEFGAWVGEVSGLPVYGGGQDAVDRLVGNHKRRVRGEDGSRSVVCSIQAHGTGLDGLQLLFAKALVAQPSPSNTGWEQCLDAETEILTESGWLGIDGAWGSRVAGYDVASGAVEWQAAERVERALGEEQMWGIENPHLSLRVTAGHRMVVQRATHRVATEARRAHMDYKPRAFTLASEMPRIGRIPLAGEQVAPGVSLTDHELTFLGLFMTDGNLDPTNNAISLFQSERYPEVIALIERTVEGCGFRAGRSVNTRPSNFAEKRSPLHKWQISRGSPQRADQRHLRGWGALEPYVNKDFPPAFEDLTRAQLLVVLRAMWAGDGTKGPGTYSYDRYASRTLNICTKRRVVADRVQSLCVRRGMRCVVAEARPGFYVIRVSPEDDTWQVSSRGYDARPTWGPLPSTATERVWCASVPSGAIVVRRRGKVAVVGNCVGRLFRIRQRAPLVENWFYRHTEELAAQVDTALSRALYVQSTLGSAQKLLLGFLTPEQVAAGAVQSTPEERAAGLRELSALGFDEE